MNEGAVGVLPLPQDHVHLGVVLFPTESAELLNVQGLGVDLKWCTHCYGYEEGEASLIFDMASTNA